MIFNRKTVVVTESTDDPAVSTADMKARLRVSGSGDDAIIADHVAVATEAVKQYLRRALLTETFVLRADGFSDEHGDDRLLALGPGTHTASVPYILGGGDTLELPFPPVASVTSVVTYDRDNTSSAYAASNYTLDSQSGRIFLDEGASWPSNLRSRNAVEVTYVAGYGSGNIPGPIVEAIKAYVSQMYDGCDGMTDEARRLLAPYRIMDGLAW